MTQITVTELDPLRDGVLDALQVDQQVPFANIREHGLKTKADANLVVNQS